MLAVNSSIQEALATILAEVVSLRAEVVSLRAEVIILRAGVASPAPSEKAAQAYKAPDGIDPLHAAIMVDLAKAGGLNGLSETEARKILAKRSDAAGREHEADGTRRSRRTRTTNDMKAAGLISVTIDEAGTKTIFVAEGSK